MLCREKQPRGAGVAVPAAIPRGEGSAPSGQEERGSLAAGLAWAGGLD